MEQRRPRAARSAAAIFASAVAAMLAAAMLAAPARAQDPGSVQDAPPVSSDGAQITDVVVTANKRSELLKDVPTSISVIEGSQLLANHILDYEDITRAVPGLSFATQGQPGSSNLEIRGVSSTVGSQTVGIYLDDVPLLITNNYEGATEPKFLDFDRIEVLRGPQGTLYGAGSEGGTIRFISNQPVLDRYEASVRSDLSGTADGGGFNHDERATVNIPIVPGVLALRGSIEYGDTPGWIDNYDLSGVKNRSAINDERDFVGRLGAKLQLDNGLSVVAAVFAQNVKSADSFDFYPGLGLFKIQKGVVEYDRDIIVVPSLTITQDLGFADITSVSSYFWREVNRAKDGTAFNSVPIAQQLKGVFPAQQPQNDALIGTLPSPVSFHDQWETPTEELRLSSKPQSETGLPFRYTVGLYYSDQKNQHRDYEPIPGLSATYQQIYGQNINAGPLGNGTPNLFARDLVYYVSDHNDTAQYAVFGQADIDILPDLHFGIGARYLIARESFSEMGAGVFELGNAGVGSAYNQVADFHAFTPKFTLSYDVTPDVNAYASAARGFRLGGATSPNYNTFCLAGLNQLGVTSPPTSYAPDSLWTYEGGVKSVLFDRTLSINADGYDIQWSNIQQSLIIPICGGELNVNVGNAQAYGGELEVAYKPPFLRGVTFGLVGGIEHAVITSSNNQITAQPGDSVLNTPTWTVTPSVDYSWEIGDDAVGFARASYAWTGTTHSSFLVTDPNYRNPGYGVVNANVGASFGRFEAMLYARNLFNDRTIYQRPQINTVTEGYTVQPLTIGVTLSAKF